MDREKQKIYMKKWREQNIEKIRKWRKKNSEKIKKYSKEYYEKNRDKASKRYYLSRYTKHGTIMFTLRQIKARCYNPKNNAFKYYGAKGIQSNLTYKDLEILWQRDNADKLNRISIDRIDKKKDYTLGNCQFIELSENASKAHRKEVEQFTLKEKFIKKYKSRTEAMKQTGVDATTIGLCCLGKRKTAGGFLWKNSVPRK